MLSHTCPCKDCTDRYEACHDTCERFLEHKKFRLECNRKRAIQKSINTTCAGLTLHRIKSLKNKKNLL